MIEFGSKFPTTYFGGNTTMKKEYLSASDFSRAIADGRDKIADLIRVLSDPAAQWCGECFAEAPKEFFYMPTSSTGKHHGGPGAPSNCVGGNIVHTEQVLNTTSRVLRRYEEALGVFYEPLSEALRVACILHDIAKYSPDSLWVDKYHGEKGAELISGVETDYDWAALIADAVKNHMYYWKFETVYNSFQVFGAGSLNGLFLNCMLSECDYYSIVD